MSTMLERAAARAGPYELPPACGGRLRLFKGTVEHWLPKFRADYFDACLTDPPYELGFMGHDWDRLGVAFDPATWRMVLRLLKPGAHLMAFGGKYAHRLMVAAEDAGFETVDKMLWLHGQGFPKGQDIGIGIDKKKGRARGKTGPRVYAGGHVQKHGGGRQGYGVWNATGVYEGTAPASEDAERWDGYKTALKPAYEECPIFRVPLAGTFAENVLLYDTGGLNIAGCRIGSDAITVRGGGANHYAGVKSHLPYQQVNAARTGRYPSNVVLSHHPMCRKTGTRKVKGTNVPGGGTRKNKVFGQINSVRKPCVHADADGTETVEKWACVPGCPVRMLDRQSGMLTSGQLNPGHKRGVGTTSWGGGGGTIQKPYGGDVGGASRFFYVAKVARSERDAGCAGPLKDCDNFGDDAWAENRTKGGQVQQARNAHPCVKPIDLCRYFATLILPPPRKAPRRIIVTFGGSGSEAIGALLAGWDEVFMVEQDAAHVRTAAQRASYWLSDAASTEYP